VSDFEEIESAFSRLLESAALVLSEAELGEVSHFLDVGEYGLALQTAVDIFVEEGKRPPVEVISLVEQLSRSMGMEPAFLVRRLQELR
jgi:hypothetical protein